MWEDYFSVQIFFIILRETLESAIIISVLLSLVKQTFTAADPVSHKDVLTVDKTVYNNYRRQVWFGALAGLVLCLCIGGACIGVFYLVGKDMWSVAERVWEGFFSVVSALIIAVMGLALLRVNTMQRSWSLRLKKSLRSAAAEQQEDPNQDLSLRTMRSPSLHELEDQDNQEDDQVLGQLAHEPLYNDISKFVQFRKRLRSFGRKYSLVILPFITTLREGLEAVVFVGGIGVSQPATSFPLAVIAGAAAGACVGLALYKGGNKMSLQVFLIASSCFLYLVAAGLMSKGVWFFELERFVQRCGEDTSESGSGPGSYDIANTIWHVNCCNGLTDGGWMLFNALLGWTNTATYGSVASYVLFWVFIVALLRTRAAIEQNGYCKYLPVSWQLKKIKKRIAMDRVLLQEYLDTEGADAVHTASAGASEESRETSALLSSTADQDQ